MEALLLRVELSIANGTTDARGLLLKPRSEAIKSGIAASIALVKAVRAAGSWTKYALLPHKRVLALRSLRVRGRATTTPATPPYLDRLLAPSMPTDVIWHVLEYWLETS